MNQLVTDLSGQDNLNQPCSDLTLLPPLCHRDDLPLVGPALCDTDDKYIEEQVTCALCPLGCADRHRTEGHCPVFGFQLHGSGVGGASLENDAFRLCETSEEAPAALPPAIALTDAAISLFGVLFPHIILAQR